MAKVMPMQFLGLVAGASTNKTFSSPAREISITTDKTVLIATTAAALLDTPDGNEGDPVEIPGGTNSKSLPWGSETDLHIKNIDTTDSVKILIQGVR
jgi:hypothetical protein